MEALFKSQICMLLVMEVSIILLNYNYERYLSNSIDSVLSQTYPDFELIIVDDGSTDRSLEILQRYVKEDKRIQLITHNQNKGILESVRNGIDRAQGKYCHFLSSDDMYLPHFLEKTLHFLRKNPQLGMCCSDYGYFLDQQQEILLTQKLLEHAGEPLIFSSSIIANIFRKTNFWIPGHTCVAKRDLLKQYGFFNACLHSRMDWFLLHTIALFEGIGYIPETLSAMRHHKNSYSVSCNKNKSIEQEMRRHFFELLKKPENTKLKKKYKKAALLGFLFKSSQALKHPSLWPFYPPLIQKSCNCRLKKLLKKPPLSLDFIKKNCQT